MILNGMTPTLSGNDPMFQCPVCGSSDAHEERVSEVFQINGKPILVENIPAQVCNRCGEPTFSRETTEKIRQLLHEPHLPSRSIQVEVFAFQ